MNHLLTLMSSKLIWHTSEHTKRNSGECAGHTFLCKFQWTVTKAIKLQRKMKNHFKSDCNLSRYSFKISKALLGLFMRESDSFESAEFHELVHLAQNLNGSFTNPTDLAISDILSKNSSILFEAWRIQFPFIVLFTELRKWAHLNFTLMIWRS